MLYRHHDGVDALYIQEGFLLAGKRGIRHIFCGCRGAHGKRRGIIISRKLLIGVQNGGLQLGQERCLHDPLTNLLTRFCQCINVINIGLIQQRINALIQPALIEEQVKGVGCGRETVGHGNAQRRQISNHFTQRGIFAPTRSTSCMPSWLYQSTSGCSPLLDIELILYQ